MNFLLLINGAPKYKYFFAEIAKKIEAQGHSVYFAVNAKKSSILEPLDYIDKSKNSFFFDDYMSSNLEEIKLKKNNINETWGDVFYSDFDRFFFHNYNLENNSDYWLEVVKGLDCFFEEIINTKEIDIVLYENVSNSFAYMAYKKIIQSGKIYLGLMSSRIPNRYEIQTSIYKEELNFIESLIVNQYDKEEEDWYKDYLSSILSIQPDYMKNNVLNSKITLNSIFKFKKIRTLYIYLKVFMMTDYYFDYQTGHPIKNLLAMFLLNFKKRKNENATKKYYISNIELEKHIKNGEIFFIYPTHYHPESSTSVLASNYTNEFNNILNIHNSLPVGTYLYVKDHISARGVQNEEFYIKIKALPGVRLIDFNYNVKSLIKESQGIITVNSTVGYEAIILGKPVFLLGNVFYERFPNVFKVESFYNLKQCINNFVLASDIEVKKYILAYYRYTYPGKLLINQPEKWSGDYFENLVSSIFHKIESINSK